MKNGVSAFLSLMYTAAISAASACVFIYLYRSGVKLPTIIAVALISFCVGCVLSALLHELGHLLPLIGKAKVLEFSVLFLAFKLTPFGYKLGFTREGYGGYASFALNKGVSAKSMLRRSVLGALAASVLCALNFSIMAVISCRSSGRAVCGGAIFAALVSAHMLLINFFTFSPSTDGAVLFNARGALDEAALTVETESGLFRGEKLSEMPDELFSGGGNAFYTSLRLLEMGESDLAESVVNDAESADNRSIALLSQKFYFAVLNKNAPLIDELKYIVPELDADGGPTSLRVLIAYRGYTGEKEWQRLLAETFSKQSENCLFKGLYETEKTIVERLLK